MSLPSPYSEISDRFQRSISVAEGQILFHELQNTRGLFYLSHGEMELRRYTEVGNEIVIHRVTSGETFAEASLFSKTFHCSAIAIRNSLIIEIDRNKILEQFESNATFAKVLAGRFASQVQSYRRRLEISAIRSAKERVYIAISDGMLTGNIVEFAREVGLTHEATYRALAELVNEHRLEKDARGKYRIPLN